VEVRGAGPDGEKLQGDIECDLRFVRFVQCLDGESRGTFERLQKRQEVEIGVEVGWLLHVWDEEHGRFCNARAERYHESTNKLHVILLDQASDPVGRVADALQPGQDTAQAKPKLLRKGSVQMEVHRRVVYAHIGVVRLLASSPLPSTSVTNALRQRALDRKVACASNESINRSADAKFSPRLSPRLSPSLSKASSAEVGGLVHPPPLSLADRLYLRLEHELYVDDVKPEEGRVSMSTVSGGGQESEEELNPENIEGQEGGQSPQGDLGAEESGGKAQNKADDMRGMQLAVTVKGATCDGAPKATNDFSAVVVVRYAGREQRTWHVSRIPDQNPQLGGSALAVGAEGVSGGVDGAVQRLMNAVTGNEEQRPVDVGANSSRTAQNADVHHQSTASAAPKTNFEKLVVALRGAVAASAAASVAATTTAAAAAAVASSAGAKRGGDGTSTYFFEETLVLDADPANATVLGASAVSSMQTREADSTVMKLRRRKSSAPNGPTDVPGDKFAVVELWLANPTSKLLQRPGFSSDETALATTGGVDALPVLQGSEVEVSTKLEQLYKRLRQRRALPSSHGRRQSRPFAVSISRLPTDRQVQEQHQREDSTSTILASRSGGSVPPLRSQTQEDAIIESIAGGGPAGDMKAAAGTVIFQSGRAGGTAPTSLGLSRRDLHALSSWLPAELVPLVVAAAAGALGLVVHLVRVNTTLSRAQFGSRGLTALHLAAAMDDMAFVRILLAEGARLGVTDFSGRTAGAYALSLPMLKELGVFHPASLAQDHSPPKPPIYGQIQLSAGPSKSLKAFQQKRGKRTLRTRASTTHLVDWEVEVQIPLALAKLVLRAVELRRKGIVMFEGLDKGKDGTVSAEQFGMVLRDLGASGLAARHALLMPRHRRQQQQQHQPQQSSKGASVHRGDGRVNYREFLELLAAVGEQEMHELMERHHAQSASSGDDTSGGAAGKSTSTRRRASGMMALRRSSGAYQAGSPKAATTGGQQHHRHHHRIHADGITNADSKQDELVPRMVRVRVYARRYLPGGDPWEKQRAKRYLVPTPAVEGGKTKSDASEPHTDEEGVTARPRPMVGLNFCGVTVPSEYLWVSLYDVTLLRPLHGGSAGIEMFRFAQRQREEWFNRRRLELLAATKVQSTYRSMRCWLQARLWWSLGSGAPRLHDLSIRSLPHCWWGLLGNGWQLPIDRFKADVRITVPGLGLVSGRVRLEYVEEAVEEKEEKKGQIQAGNGQSVRVVYEFKGEDVLPCVWWHQMLLRDGTQHRLLDLLYGFGVADLEELTQYVLWSDGDEGNGNGTKEGGCSDDDGGEATDSDVDDDDDHEDEGRMVTRVDAARRLTAGLLRLLEHRREEFAKVKEKGPAEAVVASAEVAKWDESSRHYFDSASINTAHVEACIRGAIHGEPPAWHTLTVHMSESKPVIEQTEARKVALICWDELAQLGFGWGGPKLPIEFARVSRGGRLLPVIVSGAALQDTLYTVEEDADVLDVAEKYRAQLYDTARLAMKNDESNATDSYLIKEKLLRLVFDQADRSGDGSVSMRELQLALHDDDKLCELLGLPVNMEIHDGTWQKFRLLMREMDSNGNGTLSFEEFKEACAKVEVRRTLSKAAIGYVDQRRHDFQCQTGVAGSIILWCKERGFTGAVWLDLRQNLNKQQQKLEQSLSATSQQRHRAAAWSSATASAIGTPLSLALAKQHLLSLGAKEAKAAKAIISGSPIVTALKAEMQRIRWLNTLHVPARDTVSGCVEVGQLALTCAAPSLGVISDDSDIPLLKGEHEPHKMRTEGCVSVDAWLTKSVNWNKSGWTRGRAWVQGHWAAVDGKTANQAPVVRLPLDGFERRLPGKTVGSHEGGSNCGRVRTLPYLKRSSISKQQQQQQEEVKDKLDLSDGAPAELVVDRSTPVRNVDHPFRTSLSALLGSGDYFHTFACLIAGGESSDEVRNRKKEGTAPRWFRQLRIVDHGTTTVLGEAADGVSMVELRTSFDRADEYLFCKPDLVFSLSTVDWTTLYALRQQATVGECDEHTVGQPGIFSRREDQLAWRTWYDLRGMSKCIAMKRFVQRLDRAQPGWQKWAEGLPQLDELGLMASIRREMIQMEAATIAHPERVVAEMDAVEERLRRQQAEWQTWLRSRSLARTQYFERWHQMQAETSVGQTNTICERLGLTKSLHGGPMLRGKGPAAERGQSEKGGSPAKPRVTFRSPREYDPNFTAANIAVQMAKHAVTFANQVAYQAIEDVKALDASPGGAEQPTDGTELDALMGKLRSVLKQRKRGDVDAVFDEFDKNGDNVLSRAEFGNAMAKLGLDLTSEEMERLMRRFDNEGKGVVSAKDFVSFVLKDDEQKDIESNDKGGEGETGEEVGGDDNTALVSRVDESAPSFGGDTVSIVGEETEASEGDESDDISMTSDGMDVAEDVIRKLRGILKNHKRGDVDAVFDEFDTNKDGVLSREEFGKGLLKLDLKLTMEDKDRLMARLDSDGSGMVSAKEFINFVFVDQKGDASPSIEQSYEETSSAPWLEADYEEIAATDRRGTMPALPLANSDGARSYEMRLAEQLGVGWEELQSFWFLLMQGIRGKVVHTDDDIIYIIREMKSDGVMWLDRTGYALVFGACKIDNLPSRTRSRAADKANQFDLATEGESWQLEQPHPPRPHMHKARRSVRAAAAGPGWVDRSSIPWRAKRMRAHAWYHVPLAAIKAVRTHAPVAPLALTIEVVAKWQGSELSGGQFGTSTDLVDVTIELESAAACSSMTAWLRRLLWWRQEAASRQARRHWARFAAKGQRKHKDVEAKKRRAKGLSSQAHCTAAECIVAYSKREDLRDEGISAVLVMNRHSVGVSKDVSRSASVVCAQGRFELQKGESECMGETLVFVATDDFDSDVESDTDLTTNGGGSPKRAAASAIREEVKTRLERVRVEIAEAQGRVEAAEANASASEAGATEAGMSAANLEVLERQEQELVVRLGALEDAVSETATQDGTMVEQSASATNDHTTTMSDGPMTAGDTAAAHEVSEAGNKSDEQSAVATEAEDEPDPEWEEDMKAEVLLDDVCWISPGLHPSILPTALGAGKHRLREKRCITICAGCPLLLSPRSLVQVEGTLELGQGKERRGLFCLQLRSTAERDTLVHSCLQLLLRLWHLREPVPHPSWVQRQLHAGQPLDHVQLQYLDQGDRFVADKCAIGVADASKVCAKMAAAAVVAAELSAAQGEEAAKLAIVVRRDMPNEHGWGATAPAREAADYRTSAGALLLGGRTNFGKKEGVRFGRKIVRRRLNKNRGVWPPILASTNAEWVARGAGRVRRHRAATGDTLEESRQLEEEEDERRQERRETPAEMEPTLAATAIARSCQLNIYEALIQLQAVSRRWTTSPDWMATHHLQDVAPTPAQVAAAKAAKEEAKVVQRWRPGSRLHVRVVSFSLAPKGTKSPRSSDIEPYIVLTLDQTRFQQHLQQRLQDETPKGGQQEEQQGGQMEEGEQKHRQRRHTSVKTGGAAWTWPDESFAFDLSGVVDLTQALSVRAKGHAVMTKEQQLGKTELTVAELTKNKQMGATVVTLSLKVGSGNGSKPNPTVDLEVMLDGGTEKVSLPAPPQEMHKQQTPARLNTLHNIRSNPAQRATLLKKLRKDQSPSDHVRAVTSQRGVPMEWHWHFEGQKTVCDGTADATPRGCSLLLHLMLPGGAQPLYQMQLSNICFSGDSVKATAGTVGAVGSGMDEASGLLKMSLLRQQTKKRAPKLTPNQPKVGAAANQHHLQKTSSKLAGLRGVVAFSSQAQHSHAVPGRRVLHMAAIAIQRSKRREALRMIEVANMTVQVSVRGEGVAPFGSTKESALRHSFAVVLGAAALSLTNITLQLVSTAPAGTDNEASLDDVRLTLVITTPAKQSAAAKDVMMGDGAGLSSAFVREHKQIAMEHLKQKRAQLKEMLKKTGAASGAQALQKLSGEVEAEEQLVLGLVLRNISKHWEVDVMGVEIVFTKIRRVATDTPQTAAGYDSDAEDATPEDEEMEGDDEWLSREKPVQTQWTIQLLDDHTDSWVQGIALVFTPSKRLVLVDMSELGLTGTIPLDFDTCRLLHCLDRETNSESARYFDILAKKQAQLHTLEDNALAQSVLSSDDGFRGADATAGGSLLGADDCLSDGMMDLSMSGSVLDFNAIEGNERRRPSRIDDVLLDDESMDLSERSMLDDMSMDLSELSATETGGAVGTRAAAPNPDFLDDGAYSESSSVRSIFGPRPAPFEGEQGTLSDASLALSAPSEEGEPLQEAAQAAHQAVLMDEKDFLYSDNEEGSAEEGSVGYISEHND
jgi:Ca2+-binding EF-hand superfamily protein/acyl-CoA-binding protein